MNTASKIRNAELEHILAKTRDATAGGIGSLSMGEALAAALVLNREHRLPIKVVVTGPLVASEWECRAHIRTSANGHYRKFERIK